MDNTVEQLDRNALELYRKWLATENEDDKEKAFYAFREAQKKAYKARVVVYQEKEDN